MLPDTIVHAFMSLPVQVASVLPSHASPAGEQRWIINVKDVPAFLFIQPSQGSLQIVDPFIPPGIRAGGCRDR